MSEEWAAQHLFDEIALLRSQAEEDRAAIRALKSISDAARKWREARGRLYEPSRNAEDRLERERRHHLAVDDLYLALENYGGPEDPHAAVIARAAFLQTQCPPKQQRR